MLLAIPWPREVLDQGSKSIRWRRAGAQAISAKNAAGRLAETCASPERLGASEMPCGEPASQKAKIHHEDTKDTKKAQEAKRTMARYQESADKGLPFVFAAK
jgi:hypothetical protein